jgi:flagellar M-ring protein FliF
VQALVDQVLGPGHASIAVTADLDLDKVEKQVRTVEPVTAANQAPTSWQWQSETYGSGGTTGAGGIPGTNSNVPGLPVYPNASPSASGAPGASASPGPDYAKVNQTVNYANSETVASIVQQPGTIKRLSVAVLIDSSALGAVPLETLQSAIDATVGKDEARGDTVSVSQVAFAAAAAPLPEAGMDVMGMAGDILPTIGGGILALVLLLLVWRNMGALRGRAEDMQLIASRMQLQALGSGGGYEPALAAAGRLDPAELPVANSAQAKIQERLRLMAEDKPDELVGLVNTWLNEEERPRRR